MSGNLLGFLGIGRKPVDPEDSRLGRMCLRCFCPRVETMDPAEYADLEAAIGRSPTTLVYVCHCDQRT